MTRAWFLRRLVGDVRRHGAAWLALGAAFAIVGFVAAGARLAQRATAAAPAEPEALVIAYLADELDAPGVAELRRVLSTLPGVVDVRALSAREGLERLRAGLGARAALLEGVGADLLSPSLEIVARPAGTAAALAFRLRRLRGVSDVDLVSEAPPAASARPGPLAVWVRAPVVLGGALGLLALVAALRLLGARLRLELGLLFSLGLSRAASARPARWLATTSGLLGAGLGLVAAALAARAWGGGRVARRASSRSSSPRSSSLRSSRRGSRCACPRRPVRADGRLALALVAAAVVTGPARAADVAPPERAARDVATLASREALLAQQADVARAGARWRARALYRLVVAGDALAPGHAGPRARRGRSGARARSRRGAHAARRARSGPRRA